MACRVAKKAIYIVSCNIQETDRGINCPAPGDCVITQGHTDDAFQIILLSSFGHSIYNSDRAYTPRIYQL